MTPPLRPIKMSGSVCPGQGSCPSFLPRFPDDRLQKPCGHLREFSGRGQQDYRECVTAHYGQVRVDGKGLCEKQGAICDLYQPGKGEQGKAHGAVDRDNGGELVIRDGGVEIDRGRLREGLSDRVPRDTISGEGTVGTVLLSKIAPIQLDESAAAPSPIPRAPKTVVVSPTPASLPPPKPATERSPDWGKPAGDYGLGEGNLFTGVLRSLREGANPLDLLTLVVEGTVITPQEAQEVIQRFQQRISSGR